MRIWKQLFKEISQVENIVLKDVWPDSCLNLEMAPGLKVLGVRVTKPKIPEAIRWDLLVALSN